MTAGTKWIRAGLLLLAVPQCWIGLWASLAPDSWFHHFPELGFEWTAKLGPYNEHLSRDVGFGFLATGVMVGCAAIWPERRLVIAALVAWLFFAVPHFLFHLTTSSMYSPLDNALQMFFLVLVIAIPIALLYAIRRKESH